MTAGRGWAGLLYGGGAWWVTSVRGSGEAEVLRGLRELAPRYSRDRLLAVPWLDGYEAAYQLMIAHGGYLCVCDPGLLRAGEE
jgi:hypothetical protein